MDKEKRRIWLKKYYKTHKRDRNKLRAKWQVRNYLKYGLLKKLSCVVCGREKSEAHHPDYNKQVDVIWLCRLHHKRLHMILETYSCPTLSVNKP